MSSSQQNSFQFDPNLVQSSPRTIATALRQLTGKSQRLPIVEQREHPRFYRDCKVTVQELDESYRLIGEPVDVSLRDVSVGGIAICHTRALRSRFLALELRSPESTSKTQMVVEVLRSHPIGADQLIAGKFVTPRAESEERASTERIAPDPDQ